MDYEVLKKILNYGAQAPSGDNCQPWLVKATEDKIFLFLDPQKDNSLYNYEQQASFMALGAFIENVYIAANQFGYEPKIALFPDPSNINIVATLNFLPQAKTPQELFDSMLLRCTNRKKYNKYNVSSQEKQKLFSDPVTNVSLKIADDPEQIKKLAQAASVNEALVLQNFFLHNFLFSHITWTEAEANQKRSGMFIKTLEMDTVQQMVFRLCRNGKFLNFLNHFGFYNLVARTNQSIYSTSSGIGLLQVDNLLPSTFINAGRAMQRIWLKITSMGLSMQPLTGITFLQLRLTRGNKENITSYQITKINEAYKKIAQIFSIPKGSYGAFMFRFGQAEKPSAISSKRNLEIT